MTYNVHGCRGMDREICYSRIADVIERYDPDVVALQELDLGRQRSALMDQTRAIAELVSMECHFHPALRVAEEEYGDAILSKFPLTILKAGGLPEPARKWVDEPRGALWVALNIRGQEVQVINTHLGLGRMERRMQARALLGEEWLGAASQRGTPVVICGDFNSPSGGMVHRLFQTRLRDAQLAVPGGQVRRTFPTRFPVLCLDYVFVSEGLRVLRAEVPRTPLTRVASDHLPVIVDLEFAAAAEKSETAGKALQGERFV
jgi:endonuclease/exonuclease/phosphatase family metal-dependent hydrolase